MPPWTIPKSAERLSPWASRLRSAHRSDRFMERRAASSVAGYGVHSSKIMTMSEPRARWTCMDFSGVSSTVEPLIGDLKVTPASVTFVVPERLNTWKPPESVSIGRAQPAKSCRSPCASITSVPGRSIRWKVLPSMISAPVASRSRGSMPLTVP